VIAERLGPSEPRRWVFRLALTAGLAAIVVGGLVVAGTGPRPLPIVAGIVAVVMAVSLSVDLAAAVRTTAWPIALRSGAPTGEDPRVRRIEQAIATATSNAHGARSFRVRSVLRDLAVRRVAERHGEAVAADPALLADAIGPDLLAWLDDPEAPHVRRREIADALTRIEQL